jgi:hypothetical protein
MRAPRNRSRRRAAEEPEAGSGRRVDADGVCALEPDELQNAAEAADLLIGIVATLPTTSDTDLYAVALVLGYMRRGLLAHVATCPHCKDTAETVDTFIRRAMDRGAAKYRLEREEGGYVEGEGNVH